LYIYISWWKDRARKGGCILLPIDAEELRELEIPSSWSFRLKGLYPPSILSQRIQGVVASFRLEPINRGS
jgi:hypothetical protein